MTILVVGDANADLSAALARFPTEGDDAAIASLGWGSGGSAANVAAALALLGERASLLARVGRDPAADVALRVARAAGADLSALQIDHALASGLCFAAVSPGGERTFFSYRGANVALEPPEQPALLDGARWLHVAGHALLEGRQRATTLALIEAAAARDLPISLDLCLPTLRAWRAETQALLPRLRILFANELELAELCPGRAQGDAAADLLGHGVGLAAIKLGPHGCLIAGPGLAYRAPAFAVEALDTNGCGDAFVAGFLYAHLRGEPPEVCAALGNALGGLAATRYGAAEALPDRARLRDFLAEREQPRLAALLGEAPPAALATAGGPPARISWPADGKEMVLVPAGPFVLGAERSHRTLDQPAHQVVLPAFYIDRAPVTVAEYLRFVQATGHKPPRLLFPGPRPLDFERHPVTGVSWHDARAYAAWAGKRLPTEAEWEKAASWDPAAAAKRRYPWGDEWDSRRCNMLDSGIGHTTPVGFFSPHGDSPCGATDMAGNVFEWTSSMDWNYPYRIGDGRDELDRYGTRVRRGGAYTSEEVFMRTTTRQLSPPDGMFLADGFRCAVDGDKVTR
ncbi:MAG: SUMF1/EgtB/PvdO family nonheme iron enzyme [Kouleothrix sp.]|nr:SUMF1/EgtB/PvdO family nonheme iron enzyme [Kouleothrix sp.]